MLPFRNEVKTHFDPWDAENRPGARVRDQWNIPILNLNHPPKKSEEFQQWLSELKERIAISMRTHHHVIFTDASVSKDDDTIQAGTAGVIYYLGLKHHTFKKGGGPNTFSFEAECMAIMHALEFLLTRPSGSSIIYSDSQGALQVILKPSTHLTQATSIRACKAARALLNRGDRLTLAWCPGHTGVAGNELADAAAKEASKLPIRDSFPRTCIQTRAEFRKTASGEWRDDYSTQSGRNTLILKSNGRDVLPTLSDPEKIIKAANNNISFLARFIRAVTNHAPTGEYRSRWHPEANTECQHDQYTHTRIHVLTECNAYSRSFISMRELLAYDDSLTAFLNFLEKNPGAFSFEDAPYEPP